MDRQEVLAELARVKRLRERAAAAQEAATKATDPAIVDALKAGLGPTEIGDAAGVSDGYVRGVRRKHGLPANPSYAGLTPPKRTPKAKTAAPVEAPSQVREPEPWASPSLLTPTNPGPAVSDRILRIPPPASAQLVRTIAERNPQWHGEQQRQMAASAIPELKWPYVEIERALDPTVGILDERDMPVDRHAGLDDPEL